mgnify:CR=1 FL=1
MKKRPMAGKGLGLLGRSAGFLGLVGGKRPPEQSPEKGRGGGHGGVWGENRGGGGDGKRQRRGRAHTPFW